MVIGARIFFITEETEIIGNDERVRTELYLYSLCRARRRKTIVKINGKNPWGLWDLCDLCEIKSKSIISGIIMVIMIISFRTKTNTDYADLADHSKGTQNE